MSSFGELKSQRPYLRDPTLGCRGQAQDCRARGQVHTPCLRAAQAWLMALLCCTWPTVRLFLNLKCLFLRFQFYLEKIKPPTQIKLYEGLDAWRDQGESSPHLPGAERRSLALCLSFLLHPQATLNPRPPLNAPWSLSPTTPFRNVMKALFNTTSAPDSCSGSSVSCFSHVLDLVRKKRKGKLSTFPHTSLKCTWTGITPCHHNRPSQSTPASLTYTP